MNQIRQVIFDNSPTHLPWEIKNATMSNVPFKAISNQNINFQEALAKLSRRI